MLIPILSYFTLASFVESAVLDPALYLAPSPPLMQGDSLTPGEMWLQPVEARTERIAREAAEEVEKIETTSQKQDAESRMFWPRFSQAEPTLGVHIPLTFSLSGSYGKVAPVPVVAGNTYPRVAGIGTSITGIGTSLGKVAAVPAGVIGNTYTAISGFGSNLFGKSAVASVYGNYGRSRFAGSSYGNYGTGVRVYGGDNVPSWSGWGNGKWGHYGKG